MRVFVTGATGFIGSATVQALLQAGHQVTGLARSDASAQALGAAGAQVHRGELTDLDSLRRGAAQSDGVIHTAFIHDFSRFQENGEIDRRAIAAMGEALEGGGRPLVVSSGTLLVSPGQIALESQPYAPGSPRGSDEAAEALVGRGVRAISIRLPPTVHGQGDHGFVPQVIAIARERGVSAYVGEGQNRWPAVHRTDAAQLFRLALEKGEAGARYHAVDDEGVPVRQIAEVIGKRLSLPLASKAPEEAGEHFGFLGMFLGLDAPASSAWTRDQLGWAPTGPKLLADLDHPYYFEA